MRYGVVAVSIAGLFALPALSRAQVKPAAQPAGAHDSRPVLTSLKNQLRNLVSAEEAFYASKSSYTNSLKDLGYVARDGAYVMVFRASDKGWAGRAVHPSLPGKSCVIWVGDAEKDPPKTDELQLTAREGEPICDSP